MSNKKAWFLCVLCVVVLFVLVGLVGGSCVSECEQAGNTESRCLKICNP